jgi:hypothetical protein
MCIAGGGEWHSSAMLVEVVQAQYATGVHTRRGKRRGRVVGACLRQVGRTQTDSFATRPSGV